MTSAFATMNLPAFHTKLGIPAFLNGFIAGRLVKTRPTCTAFKLGFTFKQQLSTTYAIVNPFYMIIPIGVMERRLCSLFPRNPELLICQLLLPFRFCF